ncbi:HxlR family transcriptional regulator [Lentzea aerocolonigenes]|uniref:HxlR family transcriptional regulator n=1 Tax=Lentzea aerocolonigenes TaxID=68170 RepID=A0A0F0GL34_LENAE|nr:helix-turn-helix domain-containing protein [Lentzea aerocolonigenes]KJK43276.1 HxlR family transcriptional regulator [Lentzea aerocolonigenes]
MTGITRTRTCPPPMNDGGAVREVFDRISDKWSLLVVGALREGPLRFGELEKAITGISQRMLTLTLKHLVQDGLVSRTAYAEVPPRVEYEVTPLGKTLVPLVIALAEWAIEHRDEINANRRGALPPTGS